MNDNGARKRKWRLLQRFKTIYWQNLLLMVLVVALAMSLLGASFFVLSYNYTRNERAKDMRAKAGVVSRMVSTYVTSGSLSGMQELATFAASVTDRR